MNIFVLDRDPILAAQYQHDKHVVKMVLETAQLLSTARPFAGCYKPTHHNHPCTRWAAVSETNYSWLLLHGLALAKEYTHRYSKRHKSYDIILAAHKAFPVFNDDAEPGTFAQAMPDQYKQLDPVAAYRAYYVAEKAKQSKWTNRPTPEWLR
jgi:hypothetical protein